tara:strand:+ start:10737 stop:11378 length:642 start_codon:yes stop_codon:yes gene_type:complete
MTVKKIILFSGGIDSTILALQHAISLKSGKALLLHIDYDHPAKEAEKLASLLIYKKLISYYDDTFEYQSLYLPINAKSMEIGSGNTGSRVVPNRNAIMLNMAINVAVCNGANVIQYGAVLDDVADYVDCRPEFLKKINSIADEWNVRIEAPLMDIAKDEIFHDSNHIVIDVLSCCSSCYQPLKINNNYVACGTCNSCISNGIQKGDQIVMALP